ncbi:unnamed protein product [Chrysodeixis includens]|uniref:Uncharacterized protein n=1 Tax=Chrysodeixis includens TaxID=689277 RepID=A0A9P0FW75_CHRIL|nr:unnamed protein product [Chrysodeixis includens]
MIVYWHDYLLNNFDHITSKLTDVLHVQLAPGNSVQPSFFYKLLENRYFELCTILYRRICQSDNLLPAYKAVVVHCCTSGSETTHKWSGVPLLQQKPSLQAGGRPAGLHNLCFWVT